MQAFSRTPVVSRSSFAPHLYCYPSLHCRHHYETQVLNAKGLSRWTLSRRYAYLEPSLSHPHTRAERRAHRERVIRNGIELAHITYLASTRCWCEPLFQYKPRIYSCWIHHNREWVCEVSKYDKTGPVNWQVKGERDYYASGILRKDFRAGGGRRPASTLHDWGGGMHGAGAFRLAQSLQEWGGLDLPQEIDMADCVEILHDRVGTFEKGQVVSSKFFPELDSLIDLGAVVVLKNYEGPCLEPDQPITYMEAPAKEVTTEELLNDPDQSVVQVTKVELLPEEK